MISPSHVALPSAGRVTIGKIAQVESMRACSSASSKHCTMTAAAGEYSAAPPQAVRSWAVIIQLLLIPVIGVWNEVVRELDKLTQGILSLEEKP